MFNFKNTSPTTHHFSFCHWLLMKLNDSGLPCNVPLHFVISGNFSPWLSYPLHEHAQPSFSSLSYYFPKLFIILFVEPPPVDFKQCIIFHTIFEDNQENSTSLTSWGRHYKDRQGLQNNSTSLKVKGICHPRKSLVVF